MKPLKPFKVHFSPASTVGRSLTSPTSRVRSIFSSNISEYFLNDIIVVVDDVTDDAEKDDRTIRPVSVGEGGGGEILPEWKCGR